jgi:DNA-binding response OmpR family regulator
LQSHKKSPAARRPLSILIADDSVDTLLTLSTLLRDEGHAVHTCANAAIVMEAIRRYRPDVCILDIVMPGKTGFSLAREVVASKLEKQPVLIAISGVFTKPSDVAVVRASGFDHVLAKPADPSELLRIIDAVSGGDAPAAA